MDKATLATLTVPERALVAQTEPAHLNGLDEDEVGELLTRVRRARNKYSTLYRRQASAGVTTRGQRAGASARASRDRDKAEVFEVALGRVSSRLATLARQSAAALKAERLAAARAVKGSPRSRTAAPAKKSDGSATATTRRGDAALDSPVRKKTAASTRATGARKQAKRDSR